MDTDFNNLEQVWKKYCLSTESLEEGVKKETFKSQEGTSPSEVKTVNSSRRIGLKEVEIPTIKQQNPSNNPPTDIKLHENLENGGNQRRSQRKKKPRALYVADESQRIQCRKARKRKAGGRLCEKIRTREERRTIDGAICWENCVNATSTHEEKDSLVSAINSLLQNFFTENQSNNDGPKFKWEDWEDLISQELETGTGELEEIQTLVNYPTTSK